MKIHTSLTSSRGTARFKDGHSENIIKVKRNRNDITGDFIVFKTESGNEYSCLLDELVALSERSIRIGTPNLLISKRVSYEYGLSWMPTDEIEKLQLKGIFKNNSEEES